VLGQTWSPCEDPAEEATATATRADVVEEEEEAARQEARARRRCAARPCVSDLL
jgi:hypothetical protein